MLFDIEAPSLNGMILNAALALLFYVCGQGFLFESSSIGNPQYAPEVLHQTPGTSGIKLTEICPLCEGFIQQLQFVIM
jgi:hypothetical protein